MNRLLPLIALSVLAACGNKGKDADTGTTAVSPCSGLTATAASNVSTAITFSWSTDEGGTPSLSLELDGETLDIAGTTSGTEHSLTAVGLVAGGTYTWNASVETGGGTIECGPQEVKVAPAPGASMQFDTNISEAGSAVADGYLVISTIGADSAWVAVVDGEGRYRFVHGTDDPSYTIAHSRISRDGNSILWNQFDQARILDVGNIRRVSWDGSVDTETRTLLAHHDFVELPDMNSFGWVAYDRRDYSMDVLGAPAGAEAPQNCSSGMCPIAGEMLLEGDEGVTTDASSVEIYNWWNWDVEPYWVCDHQWDFSSFVPDYYEQFHVNSLAYLDSQDAYYANSRYQDVLYKIDRATGTMEWELGGATSDFTLTNGEWFDHGHFSEVWEDGFLIFDNGDHRGLTKVTEYHWDETTMEAEVVWTIDHPTAQMLPILGDAKRLPNGNYLVVWSADALIQELTPAGDVVWELQSANFGVIARADFITEIPQPAQ